MYHWLPLAYRFNESSTLIDILINYLFNSRHIYTIYNNSCILSAFQLFQQLTIDNWLKMENNLQIFTGFIIFLQDKNDHHIVLFILKQLAGIKKNTNIFYC
jgi:hypothetical protein